MGLMCQFTLNKISVARDFSKSGPNFSFSNVQTTPKSEDTEKNISFLFSFTNLFFTDDFN
jgi:hypothetical protein